MPGYYDWKIRNCTAGAIAKGKSLMATFNEVDPYLIRLWEGQDETFSELQAAKLAAIVETIDTAEDALEAAKLALAEFFPGKPSASVAGTGEEGR
jgi:hypothetical protein